MTKLTIHEIIFETEKALYILAMFLVFVAVLIFTKVLAVHAALGVLCVANAFFISIGNLLKVREIMFDEKTIKFISRFNEKTIIINELSEIKPIQSDKLRFIAYSNIVTVNRAFTGMAELIAMLKSGKPGIKVSGI